MMPAGQDNLRHLGLCLQLDGLTRVISRKLKNIHPAPPDRRGRPAATRLGLMSCSRRRRAVELGRGAPMPAPIVAFLLGLAAPEH